VIESQWISVYGHYDTRPKSLRNFVLTWAECNVMNILTASKGSSGIHTNESREHRKIKREVDHI
jgi:hypothetical protein